MGSDKAGRGPCVESNGGAAEGAECRIDGGCRGKVDEGVDGGGGEGSVAGGTLDRIERSVQIAASRALVWSVLADAKEFGQWFGVKIEGEFSPGARVKGQVTHRGYEHVVWDIVVVRMEPERAFSYRWHPYAVEVGVDYSKEEPTLVEFTLEECTLQDGVGGTRLTVVESGFDKVPLERRALAYRMNSGGWDYQVEAIRAYVTKARKYVTEADE